ncbi:cell division protein FtsA [Oleiagrimonas soli]|uniref:Cell division protein FtsA n=1 Tax=Oleiagrimonas soli TaxID=1543381 RepID=A0A099CVM1_9GAMM|nr:cell division protein FtsA [Oleiagrimonas soli]KGI77055.1 cell division protein FtsA [Oleiagrimonas soli]MBB6185417.1 cell division protein FtsA [Oleiagrimonas soli]
MNRKNEKQLVVGLDIGTSKVVAIVGEYEPGEPVEVIGVGSHVSRGLKRGSVVDIESTVHSIQRAVEEAELMAGCDIRSVYASISGSHLETKNSHGTAAIRDREVTASDLEQVLEAARAVAIPADRKVLYKEPQEYRIDGQDGIRHPVGMSGVRLEASVHLVTGAAPAVHNITKCISRCGLSVDELVPSAVASAKAVLTDDERELGVCLVDIGAGTTDIAIYTQGAIRYTKALPVGGDQVTNDIAYGVHTPTAHAEEIKIKYACALAQLARAEETIQVPSVGDRPPRRLARQALAQSVQARYEEIFEMVQDELRRSGFESMVAAGVVLTGGASRMEGALELAEEVFHKMVRLGHPTQVSGFGDVVGNPINASGVGLLLHGARSGGSRLAGGPIGPGMGGVVDKVRDWLTRNF